MRANVFQGGLDAGLRAAHGLRTWMAALARAVAALLGFCRTWEDERVSTVRVSRWARGSTVDAGRSRYVHEAPVEVPVSLRHGLPRGAADFSALPRHRPKHKPRELSSPKMPLNFVSASVATRARGRPRSVVAASRQLGLEGP